mmetsp:Transcript_28816/g.85280  ORF Transcript_28816/g.85280 Transcript_28816/m.85280 type:complete len:221 (+) Transcript_28816:212-874(+)
MMDVRYHVFGCLCPLDILRYTLYCIFHRSVPMFVFLEVRAYAVDAPMVHRLAPTSCTVWVAGGACSGLAFSWYEEAAPRAAGRGAVHRRRSLSCDCVRRGIHLLPLPLLFPLLLLRPLSPPFSPASPQSPQCPVVVVVVVGRHPARQGAGGGLAPKKEACKPHVCKRSVLPRISEKWWTAGPAAFMCCRGSSTTSKTMTRSATPSTQPAPMPKVSHLLPT